MRLKQVILALFIVRFCVNISLSLLRFGIMMVREKNCYYAIALTDFFVFLSCAEKNHLTISDYGFTTTGTVCTSTGTIVVVEAIAVLSSIGLTVTY